MWIKMKQTSCGGAIGAGTDTESNVLPLRIRDYRGQQSWLNLTPAQAVDFAEQLVAMAAKMLARNVRREGP
jgi:hypothetical protein